ncbi:GL22437 [Drosophila persimilis]|uniref:GL22437 n=1 Tax=Drosophila persimilis TaxID=7234 RepID=B4H1N2_DROPE|nr:GL22437 [Drosophila persimilis]
MLRNTLHLIALGGRQDLVRRSLLPCTARLLPVEKREQPQQIQTGLLQARGYAKGKGQKEGERRQRERREKWKSMSSNCERLSTWTASTHKWKGRLQQMKGGTFIKHLSLRSTSGAIDTLRIKVGRR